MVGVAGKFKGCNTCRTRRVKCDNIKPECQKCRDSGRECGGYERPRVWITATTDDQGRCSSHPHRSLSSKHLKSPPENKAKINKRAHSSPSARVDRPVRIHSEFGSQVVRIPDPPSTKIHCRALHTKLASVVPVRDDKGQSFSIPSVSYRAVTPATNGRDFSLRGLCLTNSASFTNSLFDQSIRNSQLIKTEQFASSDEKEFLSTIGETASNSSASEVNSSRTSSLSSSSNCLFLYESSPSSRRSSTGLMYNSTPQIAPTSDPGDHWKNMLGGSSEFVKDQGPDAFRTFPDHFFFTRLFRPIACRDAISQRQATFLEEEKWCNVPWSEITKTDMDRLLDLQVQLPSLFEHGESLQSLTPTVARRLEAKELLDKCTALDQQFDVWYEKLQSSYGGAQYAIVSSSLQRSSDIQPLAVTQYQFISTQYAFLHLYFWAGKALFYRAIQHIHTIASQLIPTTSSLVITPPQPLFTSRPPMTTQPQEDPMASLSYQNLTFLHDPLSFMMSNPSALPSYDIPAEPQVYAPPPTSNDLYHFHQAVLDPTTPILPQDETMPFYNFNLEPYLDVSVSNSANYSTSPRSSSAFGSATASFTSPSRSGTPAYQAHSHTTSAPAPMVLQTPRFYDTSIIDEVYAAPPLPIVEPLAKKYSKEAVLTLALHIAHAIPFTLTSTTNHTTPGLKSSLNLNRRNSSFHTPTTNVPDSDVYGSMLARTTSAGQLSAGYLTEAQPESDVLSDFGSDAAIWPLEVATTIFWKQKQEDEGRWGLKTLETLKTAGDDAAERVRAEVWREWS